MDNNLNKRIYVAGHRGMVGSARLTQLGWQPAVPLRQGLQLACADFLKHHQRAAPAA